MKDAEKEISHTLAALSDLADAVTEGFALSIAAAYVAGVEAGKLAALKTLPPVT